MQIGSMKKHRELTERIKMGLQSKKDTTEKMRQANKIVIFESHDGCKFGIKIYGKGPMVYHSDTKGIVFYKTLSAARCATKKICPDLEPDFYKALPENAHRNARLRKAWLKRRAEIITEDSVCSSCGCSSVSSPLQIHHSTQEAYLSENFHLYETLSPELPFTLICKKCHFADHNGQSICPVCKNNYRSKQYPTCWKCSGKEETEITRFWHEMLTGKQVE